jgi:5-methylcytosine-specific restriction endonuclease McrA
MPALIGDKPLTGAERTRRWREKHPEKARATWQRWQAENPEKARENSRKSYAKHAEQERAKAAVKREANRDLIRQRSRESYWRDPSKQRHRRHLRRVAEAEFVVLPKELRRLYSQPCAACGSMEDQSLDHVIPISKGGRHSIGNLQTLCLTCNVKKANRTIMEWRLGRVAQRQRRTA